MYKIHVKRVRGQRIKKCRGFKRLIFKSLLVTDERITSYYNNYITELNRLESEGKYDEYDSLSPEHSRNSRKIKELIDLKFQEILKMQVNRKIIISIDKIITVEYPGNDEFNIYEKYITSIIRLLDYKKIKYDLTSIEEGYIEVLCSEFLTDMYFKYYSYYKKIGYNGKISK